MDRTPPIPGDPARLEQMFKQHRGVVWRLLRCRGLSPDIAADATQEVFLVGTAAEVTPVGQVGEYKFTVGPVTRQLREDYLKEVREPAKSAAAE